MGRSTSNPTPSSPRPSQGKPKAIHVSYSQVKSKASTFGENEWNTITTMNLSGPSVNVNNF
ncbi:hypothetical protein N0V94_000228 [Neodidymelliopsis sp. IMI 364377]|nr:hypothetical protein N0V94_000228 [Neodidymelliopsis sp. IMI 364377]